jgi:hypothetical protein
VGRNDYRGDAIVTMDRRRLIKLSLAGAATLAVGGRVASAQTAAAIEIRDSALAYFGQQGFTELPPLGLITGDTYNCGLRYDEWRAGNPPGRWVCIQPAARLEDIADKHRTGVLACFTMIGLRLSDADEPGALFKMVMDFLITRRKLDLTKLLFVSTEHFRPHLAGLEGARFFQRATDEAVAAGDGSGFFAPDGNPSGVASASVGIYHVAPGAAPGEVLSYPPQGYVEIAEVMIPAPIGTAEPGGGIGIERLAMAEGAPIAAFEETKIDLLRLIEDEAQRTGQPLPQGYGIYAAL